VAIASTLTKSRSLVSSFRAEGKPVTEEALERDTTYPPELCTESNKVQVSKHTLFYTSIAGFTAL
jgi:hypothetical protein